MKRTLIITLLLLVAAFSFGQTNATFNNLDVRNTTKLRGLIYPFGAVATSPINTAVHEIAMINNTTFALCRMDFEEFADSIANYLNPIIGTHWYTVPPDTIKTIYNVVVDSSLTFNENLYMPTTTATTGQIKQNGVTVFHTYHEKGDNNLFIGQGAGNFTADSSFNIGIGKYSLNTITNGYDNIGLGYNTGNKISDGYENIMIGNSSGKSLTTGLQNIFIGKFTGGLTSNGYNNTCIGYNSLIASGQKSYNVSLGWYSLSSTTIGSNNIAIGSTSLYNNLEGERNLAIGSGSLYSNKDNDGSTAIGYQAMYYADSRTTNERTTYNTAVGYEAMKGSSTAANNTGQYNTSVGYQALDAMTSGEKNTVFGVGAGGTNTTGSRNVYLGYDVGNAASYATLSDKLVIDNSNADSAGALIFGNFATKKLKINGAFLSGTGSIADNDSTPSVASYNTFIYAGSANPVSIDALDDHVVGCYYTIIGNSNTYTITVIDGTPAGGDSFNLAGGNWVGGSQDVLLLYCIAADAFIEVSRSDN